jgi:hypothetical protein
VRGLPGGAGAARTYLHEEGAVMTSYPLIRRNGDAWEALDIGSAAVGDPQYAAYAWDDAVWEARQRAAEERRQDNDMHDILKSPYPFFGGKASVASLVWGRFGIVDNYVEPFFGSGAVLLAAPQIAQHESINDRNGFICNFWRATQRDPSAVADAADYPINECDLHARHAWLVTRQEDMTTRLMGDPDYYDTKAAGWWLWGICQWIGSGWCSGQGPWCVNEDGRLVNSNDRVVRRQLPHLGDAGRGINRKLPHLGNAGMGINRQLPHLGNAGRGINRQRPHLGDAGRGINRQLPHLGNAGRGQCADWTAHLHAMMEALCDRLRRVRVCCGDWQRVCGPTPTVGLGLSACFMDPPYQMDGRDAVYDNHDARPDGANSEVFYDVVRWAIERGDDPRIRVAVCGYDEENLFPPSWSAVRWKAHGGYGSQGDGRGRANAGREAIFFSPHCLKPADEAKKAFLQPVAVRESDYAGTLFAEDAG